MSKTVKFGIIFFLLLILALLLNLLFTSSNQDNLKDYLLNKGYILENDDETRFFKVIDDKTIDYFSISEYTMTRNINDKNDSFEYSLTIKYDYKNHEITYNYRITYGNNTNVIFKGNYLEDEFTCDKEFSTVSLSQDEIQSNCDLIKIKVEWFKKEAEVLFSNYRLVEYMENISLE